jgi:hypothetical protein
MATPGYRAPGSSLRFRVAGRTAMLLGALSFIAGTLVLVQALRDLVGFGYRGPGGFHPGLPLGLLAWVGGALLTGLLGYIGTRLHRRGRQLATSAGSIVDGPFVLYLRPFDADLALAEMAQDVTSPLPKATYEEQLRDAFRTVGPMLAIGRPGEGLPTLGAARTAAHDHWQRTVLTLLPRAALVVLALGGSTGIRWEVERAVERVTPHRLLLLTFGDESWYAAARREFGRLFPLGLPPGQPSRSRRREALPISGAIWFRPDWMPIMVPFATRDPFRPLESACIAALAPVYAALGVRRPRSRWRPTALGGGCLTMLAFLAIMALAYFLSR